MDQRYHQRIIRGKYSSKKGSVFVMVSRAAPIAMMGALLVISAVLMVGCRRSAEPSAEEAPSAERLGVPLTALVDAAMHRPPGQNALPVLDRLNDPLRIETESRPNRHIPNQVDTLRTFHYPGLQFTVYDVTGDPKEIMQHIVVTDSAYATEAGVHIGMHPQQVRAALGAPDTTADGTFTYRLSEVTPSQLRVAFEGETATRLEWDFYVD